MAYAFVMGKPQKTARLSVRLTEECDRLIEALRSRYGITSGAVVEMAVREYAEQRQVKVATTAANETQEGG